MKKLKQLLSVDDVALVLGCDADTVRTLVVEERSLPAIVVDFGGHRVASARSARHSIGIAGLVYDVAVPDHHVGFLRIDRSALDAFMAQRGLAPPNSTSPSSPARESTYLNIIAGLLELVLNPRAGRSSQAAVIEELVANYSDKSGISKSTLEKVFSLAKRSLDGR